MLNRFITRSLSPLTHHCDISNFVNRVVVNDQNTQCIIADPSKSLPIIIQTTGVPIHLYTRELESQALKQLVNLAESGIANGFVAAMADVHVGVGATIGTVFASMTHVSPYAVGADIGCGMIATPIDGLLLNNFQERWKREIQQQIKTAIPTGHDARVKAHKKVDRIIRNLGECTYYLENEISDITKKQVAILNLRLEIGSRRIGKETCDHYHSLAGRQMSQRGLAIVNELKYLDIDSDEGQDYLKDMRWCLNYAEQNRRIMLDELSVIVKSVTGYEADLTRMVNIHHNYCQQENISFNNSQNELVWITRKGATSARKGQFGIIPGSMGTGSFIVEGLGNPLSFYSCSHGAGRIMSRTMAMRNISQQSFEQAMDGIVSDTNAALRDEAPQAYKDLTIVMTNQDSLVKIVHRLKPLINVKGISGSNMRYSKKSRMQR
ncbi:unnamed protein product [Rotaria magnacalcarata]|uniref:3'-phosphate/5'-hydroxy nucleic acid ligase n=1 Tax=Rotaria magnacalcarata TaxID=392030 RepID=A0A816N086_9BILA|nr:unnamed protein product [Rotaria magnacalcarata]